MQQLSIAHNNEGVFIHIDTSLTSHEKVEDALNLLRLYFFDDSHIPSVDAAEQAEIEVSLDNMSDKDREIAFTRISKL